MSTMPEEADFVEASELRERVAKGDDVVIIDVRSAEEFAAGHVEGAVNIPADRLAEGLAGIPKDAEIVTVCTLGGQRSCGAADHLKTIGYSDARPLRGGVKGWQQ